MLSCQFNNCYGIRALEIKEDLLNESNQAIIYAPNGVMKTSFAKVFEDISKGLPSTDRMYDCITSYNIRHREKDFIFNSETPSLSLSKNEFFYVINSFEDSFEFTESSLGFLLADKDTRKEYDQITEEISNHIKEVKQNLNKQSKVSTNKLEDTLRESLQLDDSADWVAIFEHISKLATTIEPFDFWEDTPYAELFDEKALSVFEIPEFKSAIDNYLESLNTLFKSSTVLNSDFTDRSAQTLTTSMKTNNLFRAQHTIHLRDGQTIISSLEEWDTTIQGEINKIYSEPSLKNEFEKLNKHLTKNADLNRVREILLQHKEIVPLLQDIPTLKINAWLYYFNHLDRPLSDYVKIVLQYSDQVKYLYDKASSQSERWAKVVEEFNRRFRVPFEIQIENKANFLLRDEAPHITFKYSPGEEVLPSVTKDELIKTLSVGEKRALYLLYILFDIKKICSESQNGNGRFLIVADDIADSFDYKNKYAIVEYLKNIGSTENIDLLILTHNFDFFRTVSSRLGINRENQLIAQREENGKINVSQFKYQNSFFKKSVVEKLKSTKNSDDQKKKLIIASITFYRNICEYLNKESLMNELTSFLHIKTSPISTESATFGDLASILNPLLDSSILENDNEEYLIGLHRIASQICSETTEEVCLENKIVMSIAIRLAAESFLKRLCFLKESKYPAEKSNQTWSWFNESKEFLTYEQEKVLDDVILITPDFIHVNSFMFEPLIDISDWVLKNLYKSLMELNPCN